MGSGEGPTLTVLTPRNRSARIREVQCQVLVSSSVGEDILTATEEHIHGLAGGRTSHRYAALSAVFMIAIGEVSEGPGVSRANPTTGIAMTPFPAGPTLECPNVRCSQANIPLFLQEIGRKTVCQVCRFRLKCHVCGWLRRDTNVRGCSGCSGSLYN